MSPNRDSIKDTLDAELNKAIEQSIATPPINREPLSYWKNTANGQSRKAVDQLAQATAGLLKVEQELDQLLMTIAGAPEAGKPSPARDQSVAEVLPIFDRVRIDATVLAELAIRMHTRIQHAMERL